MSKGTLLRNREDSNKRLKLRLRPEVLVKIRREVQRIAANGTMQGQRYAHVLFEKYPEVRV